VTIGCLILALGCYALGSVAGFGLFLVVGGVFELTFWFRILTRKKTSDEPVC